MMDAFENDVRRALGRVPMPAGLEERILVGIQSGGPKAALGGRRAWRLALAAGLALAVSVPGALAYHRHRTERARAQLVFALRLTSKKLNHALDRAARRARAGAKPTTQEETR